jgi:hypothetical protein
MEVLRIVILSIAALSVVRSIAAYRGQMGTANSGQEAKSRSTQMAI